MSDHSRPLPTAIKHIALLDAVMDAESLDDAAFLGTGGAIARDKPSRLTTDLIEAQGGEGRARR